RVSHLGGREGTRVLGAIRTGLQRGALEPDAHQIGRPALEDALDGRSGQVEALLAVPRVLSAAGVTVGGLRVELDDSALLGLGAYLLLVADALHELAKLVDARVRSHL